MNAESSTSAAASANNRHSALGTRQLVIGLIGGIGSGKSLVAAELARHCGVVISGDKFGHEALRRPDIRAQVIERWGLEVLDDTGEISRAKLGRIVFDHP